MFNFICVHMVTIDVPASVGAWYTTPAQSLTWETSCLGFRLSLPNLSYIIAITYSAECTPPSGYHYPPLQHLYSGGGGYQPTFTPPQLQQGMAQCDHSLSCTAMLLQFHNYCSLFLAHLCIMIHQYIKVNYFLSTCISDHLILHIVHPESPWTKDASGRRHFLRLDASGRLIFCVHTHACRQTQTQMHAHGWTQTHAKFFSCILCPSCCMFRPWVSLPANPCPM